MRKILWAALILATFFGARADAQNANDELYPIAVLIDELKVRPAASRQPPTVLAGTALVPRLLTRRRLPAR